MSAAGIEGTRVCFFREQHEGESGITGLYTCQDVTVACEEQQFVDDETDALLNPILRKQRAQRVMTYLVINGGERTSSSRVGMVRGLCFSHCPTHSHRADISKYG